MKKRNVKWKVIARHKDWVTDCTITESYHVEDSSIRRFVATNNGYRNWFIYEGKAPGGEVIQKRVQEIKDRIDKGDKDVFHEDVSLKPMKLEVGAIKKVWKVLYEKDGKQDCVWYGGGINQDERDKRLLVLAEMGFSILGCYRVSGIV